MNLLVGVVMGSESDWDVMQEAASLLWKLRVPYEAKVVSAHRTPGKLIEYAYQAKGRGLKVIIAGAGGAAHLPGMLAAMTDVPVLGVPIQSKSLRGLDSLLSIVQMPLGTPVATFSINGAGNAALFAASMLADRMPNVEAALTAWKKQQTDAVLNAKLPDTNCS